MRALPEEGEVQLWLINMDEQDHDAAEALSILDASERSRAERFHFPVDRRRFIRRRAALRSILAGYVGRAPREIQYALGCHGKPALQAEAGATLPAFNLSDSGSLALLAVAREGRVGVDVEAVYRRVEFLSLAHRFFAPGEFEVLSCLDPVEHRDAFFRAWTRKEALLKGVGGGLLLPLDSFEVALVPGAPPDILRWDVPGEPRGGWMLADLQPAPGYAGALAVDRPVSRVVLRAWECSDRDASLI